MSAPKLKPLFFVHTIDPILWVCLMLFIRPFFRIVCFQYRNIKEIGFKRLEISILSAQEFENCNLAGLEFAKRNNFAKLCAIHGRITTHDLDFTNYFAKEMLRSYTDLLLSAQMIRKLPDPQGFFILTRQFFGRVLREKVEISIAQASGLKCVRRLWTVFRWLQIPIRIFFALFNFWAAVVVILLKKKTITKVNLDQKIIVVANTVSELQSDFIRQLSVGFFIDGKRFKKEDVIFLTRRGPEAGKWREEGYFAYNLIDLANHILHFQAIIRLLTMFFMHPRLSVGLIVFFPPWVLYYLVLSDSLVLENKFRGLVYTNSDVTIEPIFSVPFLAHSIPVVLFYYSASTFPNSMWAFLQASHIFVWNKDMIDFLCEHPQNEKKTFLVSGPLMQAEDQFGEGDLQRLRAEFKIPFESKNQINIGIFDIAPARRDHLEQIRFVQNPKLTQELHKDFLFDIFSLGQNVDEVRMMLKPKRWTFKHEISPRINEYIENNLNRVILLPPSINPQIAIQSCQAVICFPFTSIFFAALQKGIPAIFYYPFEDDGLKKVSHLQEFTIYGKHNLVKWFVSFREGKVYIPSQEQIKNLCGLEKDRNVRDHFISQLVEVL
ncbi:MAG: hypothetical protein H6754_00385 [Candidatus Omnitrophica bacterium]|nr:hypothetical protein [Candidatus Omnitrophota bacterium]